MSTKTKLSILSFITAFLTGCILFLPYIKYGLSKFLAHDYPMFFLITSGNIILLGLLIWFLGKAFLFGLLCIHEILCFFIDNTTFFYRYIKEFVTEKTKDMSPIEKIVNYTYIWGALGLIQKLTALDINKTTSLGQTIYAWFFVPINLIGVYIGIRYILPLLLRLMFIGSEKTSSEFLETEKLDRDNSNKELEDEKRKEAINKINQKIQHSQASKKTKERLVEMKTILRTVDAAKVNTHNNKL